jgi:sugar lactone lactonase YvrE
VVSTLAGLAVGSSGAVDGKRSVARFCGVQGTALDAVGNVYVTDTGNNTVRKITPLGIVSKVAGLAGSSGTNDDVSSNARFFRPEGLGLDNAGNLYVADSGNHTVRKITASGVVSTFAGLPGTPGTNDGTGTNARFCNPSGIAVDANNNIFVAEYGSNVIRKITPTGVVTTLAGLAGSVGADDGFGTNARFALPRGIAADPFGNLYVADTGNHTIRKITSNGQVTTVAGQAGTAGGNDGLGISAQFFSPEGVAADNAGNVYVADSLNATIRMIAPDGTVSTLAGQTGSLGCADDIGRKVQFQHPKGIAVDSAGAVYVADAFNNTVRKGVPYPGPVLAGRLQNQTTLGGGNIIFSVNVTGQPPLSYQWRKDGVNIAGATGATLTIFNTAFSDAGDYDVVISNPYGAIVSGAATLFVIVPPNDLFSNATALSDNDTSITSANVGASIEPGEPFHANYPGGASVWWKWTASAPESVSLDTFGSTFPTLLAVYTGNSVSNLTPVASNYGFYSWYSLLFFDAVAGQTYYFAVDGVYGATGLIQLDFKVNTPVPPSIIEQPKGLVDMPGAIVVFGALSEGSNPINYQWRRNGSAIPGATNNMLALYYITDADAAVYDMVVSNAYGAAITQGATLALRPGYTFTTLAGNPNGGSTDATGTNAQFDFPVGVATDSSSNSYVADNSNSTIRKINPAGVVTTLAGQAGVTGSNDGANRTAQFLFPTGLAVDNATNLYVADTYNNAIRKVTPAGVVTTFAGAGGSSPGSLDGIGTNASFFLPSGVATDKAGNIYVAEAGGSLIRKITPVGSVTTIAGSPGNYGSADGIGTNALFLSPLGIAIDKLTNIFVADTYNHTIRKITPDGTVTTLAGQAGGPGCLDGAGDFARFAHPSALAVDAAGNLLVADTDNNAIRMVTPAGVVSTVAGISTASSFADGTGNGAAFYHPDGIAIDKAGTLYVSDGYNFTVRIGHAFVPPVLRFSRAPNVVVLTWPVTAPGFAAETSTGLRNAPWTPLTGGVTSDGTNFVVTNAISSAPVFYRLRLQP